MNVERRTKARKINPYEKNQQQYYMTSAGVKSSFAYEKLIELFETQVITPSSAFVWGCDYRVPMMHGLLPKEYLNDIRSSQTFKEESFAREYMGIWTGGNKDSWFNYDKLTRYRKLLNPELSQKLRGQNNISYFISVDVGRTHDQTAVTVFKVYRRPQFFATSVVYLDILGKTAETKHFAIQARDIKRLMAQFEPEELIIDANGLGHGLMDFLVQDTIDEQNKTVYPGYCSINDEEWNKKQYPNAIPKIYCIKANEKLNSEMHSNCYIKINTAKVTFLAKEQIVKNHLLSTKVGQKMSQEERIRRLLPHENTTRLFEEMANLRLKQTGNAAVIKLEKINNNLPKDRFSSLEYGLWRIKLIEDEYYKKQHKANRRRRLFFVN